MPEAPSLRPGACHGPSMRETPALSQMHFVTSTGVISRQPSRNGARSFIFRHFFHMLKPSHFRGQVGARPVSAWYSSAVAWSECDTPGTSPNHQFGPVRSSFLRCGLVSRGATDWAGLRVTPSCDGTGARPAPLGTLRWMNLQPCDPTAWIGGHAESPRPGALTKTPDRHLLRPSRLTCARRPERVR